MEPSGRNWWQPVANGTAPNAAQLGENRCRGLRPVAARVPWHVDVARRLADAHPELFVPTTNTLVDLNDADSEAKAVAWWEDLVAGGGEGMVVKPVQPISRGKKGPVQPGVKVRGPEYLRIIYGPEYTAPENLERLRDRNVGRKRSLAAREFALGVEALERLIRDEPLYRIHECVFGVLALESEPVDPRL
jgi:protein phosphatase